MTTSSDGQSRYALAKWLGVMLAVVVLGWPAFARADDGPIAPCGSHASAPNPPFIDSGTARSWSSSELPAGWAPADCIGWASSRFTRLTAVAATFDFAGTVDDLVAKFGAQSAWRGIKYWSVSDGRWDTLITDAVALDGADQQRRRGDFTASELKPGADLYFLQVDNRSSDPVTYRMRVTAIEPDRLVVTTENVSAISLLFLTLFEPGALKSTYVFVRLAPGKWGYYNLSGAREGAAVIGNHAASYLNRAAAIYRHLVGLADDNKPPLRPDCPLGNQC